jgi:hypothetical protein
MPVKMGPQPVTGLPPAQLEKALRVDFDPNLFNEAIEIKGYRMVWQRAMLCPCNGNNDQTQQVDPNCSLCRGGGWLYFRPTGYVVPTDAIGELDDIQQLLVDQPDAAVIRGVLTNLANTFDPDDKLGHWKFGDSQVTVRSENKLSYYDRLTHLDSTITYSERLEIGAVDPNLKTRYPIVEVNHFRSLTTVYDDTYYDVVDGAIVWKVGKAPASGTTVAIHYHCHPAWLVMDHPHAIRNTFLAKKLKQPATPVGTFQDLPVQCRVRYEFLA